MAQDDDEELLPGLIAKYESDNRTAERIDASISFEWGNAAPDPLLSAGRFVADWTGLVLLKQQSRYRIHAWLQGDVTVEIDGKPVLTAGRKTPGWASGDLTSLPFGELPLRVSYRRSGDAGILKLFWSSDAFSLEPISEHVLFHDEEQIALKVENRGRFFFQALRCNRCHRQEGELPSAAAPSLTHLGGALSATELVNRIQRPAQEEGTSRMPHFGFSRDEATSIAAFLVSAAETPDLELWTAPKEKDLDKQRQAGGTLFRSLGCLVCHTMDGEPNAAYAKKPGRDSNTLTTGGSLSAIGTKRSAEWLNTWLRNPDRLNVDHQMPVFRLSDSERQQLVAFLVSRTKPDDNDALPAVGDGELKKAERAAIGRQLVTRANCAACHRIRDLAPSLDSVPAIGRAVSAGRMSCTVRVPDARHLPGYPVAFRDAVEVFTRRRAEGVSPVSEFDRGRQFLETRQCLGCHERGVTRGMAAFAGQLANSDAALKGQSEALIPPALTSVGDKLQDAALERAIDGGFEKPRLPWLRVRMPRYSHTPEEKTALLRHMIGHDRIPDEAPGHATLGAAARTTGEQNAPLSADQLLLGQQLIGPRGFSCIACHEVGAYKPKNVALGTRGSDLLALGSRMRRDYYVRWTRSPARIVPGMEMPSYVKAVPGVLDGKIEAQLLATWDALNDARLVAPTNPSAVEQLLTLGIIDPARVVRDVFTVEPAFGTKTVPRAFALGLNTGHNILYDLDTLTLRQWTFGDFARQRTEGKSWYWDMAGTSLVGGCSAASDLRLVPAVEGGAAKALTPSLANGSASRVRVYDQTRYGIELKYYAFFRDDTQNPPQSIPVEIAEHINPVGVDNGRRLGFVRSIVAHRIPAEYRLEVATHQSETAFGAASIERIDKASEGWKDSPSDGETLPKGVVRRTTQAALGTDGNAQSLTLRYTAALKYEPSPLPTKPAIVPEIEKVTSVPGFDGVRLPIDRSIMPTALTWTDFGALAFTSLKGHVFLAKDTNGDGFEDALTVLEEGLAAPYGICGYGDALLIAHKPEVLMLKRVNSTSYPAGKPASQRLVFATGWGYSDNYHDWTCGIVRDHDGDFYVGTGSDYAQSERKESTAKWRGKILKLSPAGKVTPIAHALRYPTGLAFDPEGRLFASDNQGVQNTFNELNHIVEGRSYGVPARFEEQREAPETPPAVQIPHPWTRSVNGIAFLPRDVRVAGSDRREGPGESASGPSAKPPDPATRIDHPFAGHGIGCDYDTRMLVRFTIQQVGDTVQGAVYPFSLPDQGPGGENFTGPLSIGIARNGDIYIGSIHDSGWLGGLNTGDIVRLRANGKVPNGIREVRAKAEGFVIDFVHPVDATISGDAGRYSISGYTRVWKGAYATPDSGRHTAEVELATPSKDGRSVSLKVNGLKEGYVYGISCRQMTSDEKTPFFPSEAHYTLHKRP